MTRAKWRTWNMSMCRGGKERRGTIEAIPQKRERDWTIVYYQGNYLFIRTEYVIFLE